MLSKIKKLLSNILSPAKPDLPDTPEPRDSEAADPVLRDSESADPVLSKNLIALASECSDECCKGSYQPHVYRFITLQTEGKTDEDYTKDGYAVLGRGTYEECLLLINPTLAHLKDRK